MITKRISTFLSCLLAVLCLFALAHADYHYASPAGNNVYPYTSWATAALLIQDAVDASSPHDTVYIGAGEWYEAVATGVYDSVAIIGMGIDSTFMFTDEYHIAILTIDYNCSVEGITFQHLNSWKCLRARLYADVKINYCRFKYSSIGFEAAGGPSEITNCVYDSCGIPIFLPWWEGDFFISNNLITNTLNNWAIELQVHSAIVQNNIIINQPGADVTGINSGILAGDVYIRNNIVINGQHGIGVDSYQECNNIVKGMREIGMVAGEFQSLFNNSITDCNPGIRVYGDCIINYSNFYNNNVDIHNPWNYNLDSIGNIFCNPMYISDDNFHLQAFSPLIDAGDPDYLDFDSTRSDIGCYGGPFGETYEYLDLPPAIPDSIIGEFVQDTIFINWRYNTEADFSNYLLYKDTVSGFEPSVFNLIAEPETSYYADTDVDNEHSYFYRIASVDNQDNVSEYSEEFEVITTDIWDQPGATLPQITSIKTNYPNPFNTSTTFVYWVANLGPIPAEIEINIYDIVGRKVRTLMKERRDIGEHTIIWDGKDDNGNECSTGVYFARISQWGLEVSGKPRKLVLIK